jgi:hypothetical protein
MSKVTSRLKNSDIIDAAKQRYESKQKSKLPTVIIDLSSQGKIYPESSALREGHVEMRYMTAYDEDILTNISYIKKGIMFKKLMESIIVSDVDVSEISNTDMDGLIVNARILAYGKEYPVTVTDPDTNNKLERVVDLEKLTNKPFTLTPDKNGEFDFETESGNIIKFTYNADITKATNVTELLSKIITQVDDSRELKDIEQFIRYEFLSKHAKQFRDHYTKHAPGLDYDYEFEGEDGGTFIAGFQLGTDLFWF